MALLRGRVFLLLLALTLGACQTPTSGPPARPLVSVEAEEAWRGAAATADEDAIDALPASFARQAAARRGRPAAGDRELLDPALSLPFAMPAPGPYRCRLVEAVAAPAQRRGRRTATARASGFCFVTAEGDRLALTLDVPRRRLGGYLWAQQGSDGLVFLGAGFAPRTTFASPYGEAGSTAGLFQRIGEFRYRLVMIAGASGGHDVYELVAAPR